MNKLSMNAGLAAIVLVSTTAMAADQQVMVQPDTLKWSSAPPVLPKGAQIAVLYGDPDKAEPFVFRLKFPAGYKVTAHIHPNDYDLTVLSGTMYLGMGPRHGDTWQVMHHCEPARTKGLPAG